MLVLDQAELLQNILLSHATGGSEDEAEYRELRQLFLELEETESLVPRFVRTCRNLSHFWEFIKSKFPTYRERRAFIRAEFQPLLDTLERMGSGSAPADTTVSSQLERFGPASVHDLWSKALRRRQSDAEGAITMARTLLESVCKHILDDLEVSYDENDDLPKLYRATAGALNLAPSQHTEEAFKRILGGCTSVVEGLGTLRNRLSDSHGRGKSGIRPAARHAELAVNMAGSMATYLIATLEARKEGSQDGPLDS
jgi:hypothetical protein